MNNWFRGALAKPFWLPHKKKSPFDYISGQDRKRKANADGRDFSTTSISFDDKKARVLMMIVLSESIIKLDI